MSHYSGTKVPPEVLTGNDPLFTSLSAKEKTFQSSSPCPPPSCLTQLTSRKGKTQDLHALCQGSRPSSAIHWSNVLGCWPTSLSLSFLIYEIRLMILTSKDWCRDYIVNCFVNTKCFTYWLIIAIDQINNNNNNKQLARCQ